MDNQPERQALEPLTFSLAPNPEALAMDLFCCIYFKQSDNENADMKVMGGIDYSGYS